MRKRIIAAIAVAAVIASLAGCAPKAAGNSDQQEEVSLSYRGTAPSATDEDTTLKEIYEYNEELAEQWAPEITTLEDGTQVQLVPDSGTNLNFKYAPSTWNVKNLNAENRGCNACHSDLGDLVANLSATHYLMDFGLGTVKDVRTCIDCHDEGLERRDVTQRSFGDLMHGIHQSDAFDGDCMSCHSARTGHGMELWDDVKYELFRGINLISNAEGNFSYDQDTIAGTPIYTFLTGGNAIDLESEDIVPFGPFSGDQPSDEVFDNWEIAVTGMVDNPYTITMKEVLEEAPAETFVAKLHCELNNVGAENICQAELTGVPLEWFLEKAGVQEGATNVRGKSTDNYERYNYGYSWDLLAEHDVWVVWEINGERLSKMEGYPVRIWAPTVDATSSMRYLTELEVNDLPDFNGLSFEESQKYTEFIYNTFGRPYQDYIDADGVHHEDEYWINKPASAICNIHEGQIISVGEEFVFEGYADAFDKKIVAIEVSMDNEKTWTRYEVPECDTNKWVYWHFGFTPEEEGAYVFSVRGVAEDIGASVTFDKVMVNAK